MVGTRTSLVGKLVPQDLWAIVLTLLRLRHVPPWRPVATYRSGDIRR